MSQQNPERLKDYKIRLSVMGQALDPKSLTEALEANPDNHAKAGDSYLALNGETEIRKRGYWEIRADTKVHTVTGQIDSILNRIVHSGNICEAFQSIEFAILSIFIDESWTDAEFDGFAMTSVDILPRQLHRLGALGITLQVSSSFAIKYEKNP